MLTLPIYLRGNSYYLHTRIKGKQFKKSLQTSNRHIAIIKASELLKGFAMADFSDFDFSNIKKYELDLSKGVFKSDGPEDHARMLEALELAKSMQSSVPMAPSTTENSASTPKGLRVMEVLDKLFLLSPTKYSPATILAYKNAAREFANLLNNPYFADLKKSDVVRFKESCALKGNSSRTIDNKVGYLKVLFSFAIGHGYYFQPDPTEGMQSLTKREKRASAYAIFKMEEIQSLFEKSLMENEQKRDPDYYWCLMLALFTGCRISEITSLTARQIKQTQTGIYYLNIEDSKTNAGIREVPIPIELIEYGLGKFMTGKTKLFKYQERLGKGSGNAVSQKFKRQMANTGIDREKLVFHSLRKFLNNELKANYVEIEARCQYIGHEFENVNTELYSALFPIDTLHDKVRPTHVKIMSAIRFGIEAIEYSIMDKTFPPKTNNNHPPIEV